MPDIFNPFLHLLFRHSRPHLAGDSQPRLIYPQNATELRNRDERKVWDVINPTVLDFNTPGHILTFPGQIKQKMLLFGRIPYLQITFKLRRVEKNAMNRRIPHDDTHHIQFDPER